GSVNTSLAGNYVLTYSVSDGYNTKTEPRTVIVTAPPPTVATPAAASPNPVSGGTTRRSVRGADEGGEANLTSAWGSSGPGAVLFSANGTNAAKNSVATFSVPGTYTFYATITDEGGAIVTSAVSVTVLVINPPPTVVSAAVATPNPV